MRVLLTRPSTQGSSSWYFPSGLGYIARSLVDEGHDVTVIDPEVEKWDLSEHCRRIAAAQYDVLCISALINKYKYVRDLAQASRHAHPDSQIVLGGNITGPIWELLLQKTCVDVLVIGEGEVTVKEVFHCFCSGDSLEEVKGIAFSRNGIPFLTQMREPIKNLDDIPFPAYELFPMETYITTPGKLVHQYKGVRDLTMITARGCPFHCTFCYRPPWERVRYRSWENVMRELKLLIDVYRVDSIIFNDELTLTSKQRSYELCDYMEKIGIMWGCVGRVNTVDRALLQRLYKVGCRWITYGIESGSQTILNEMKKNVRVEVALDAVRWTKDAGIFTNPTFMIGYPSETHETAMESVRFMRKADLHPDCVLFATPYPGTELFHQAMEMGRIHSVEEYLLDIDGKGVEVLNVNLTRMSDQELVALRDEMVRLVQPSPGASKFRQVYHILVNEGPVALANKVVHRLRRAIH